MPYFAQYCGVTGDTYSGPVDDGYGRTGRVVFAPVVSRVADAWLDHLTLPGGWYATEVARPVPAPHVTPQGYEGTAVSVLRDGPLIARSGYEAGYIHGDQVIVRLRSPARSFDDEFYLFRRLNFADGSGRWRFPSKGWSLAGYAAWNGALPNLNCTAPDWLTGWLDTVPAPPLHDPDAVLYSPQAASGTSCTTANR